MIVRGTPSARLAFHTHMLQKDQPLKQGRYRITRQIRENGKTSTYEAQDSEQRKAVHVIAEDSADAASRSAFERHSAALVGFAHANMPVVLDHFSEGSGNYLVVEAVEGTDFAELSRQNGGAFKIDDVLRWSEQLMDAVKTLHSRTPPVVHGDINPSQLVLTSSGSFKLMPSAGGHDADASMESQGGLHFLPLEQIWRGLDSASQKVIENSYDERSADVLKQPADVRSDIYSAAATMYFLSTGEMPIDALERTIEMLDGKADPLRAASEASPAVPVEFSDVLKKAMAIKREERFDSSLIMHQVVKTAAARANERKSEPSLEVSEAERITLDQKRLEDERKLVEETRLKLEAEQKRLEAERQSIELRKQELEAEQKRKSEAAAALERSGAAAPPPSRPAPVVAADQVTASIVEDVLEIEPEPIIHADVIAEPVLNLGDIDDKPQPAPAVRSERTHVSDIPDLGGIFAGQESSGGSSMKIPAIVGALVLVVGGAIGAWMFMGSGNKPKPTPAAVVQTAPAPEPTPSLPTTAAESQIPSADLDSAVPSSEQPAAPTSTEARPAAKPRKQIAAAKPAEQKKPVTVDDIINDN